METMDVKWSSGFCNGCIMRGICKCTGRRNNRDRRSSRLEAVRRLRRALEELIIEGVKTNREFMHLLTYHKDFIRGNYNTGFWEKNHTEIEKWLKEGITVK